MIPHRNDNHLKQEISGQDRIRHEVQKIGKGMTRKEPLGRGVTAYATASLIIIETIIITMFIGLLRYYKPFPRKELGGRGAWGKG